MDFECDFNDLNFCQYSNLGFGFHKSVKYQNEVKPTSNFRNEWNYYPCSVLSNTHEGSKLEKKISLNISQSLCLQFAYLLEEKGQIMVTNGKNKWSKNATDAFSKWNYIRFPINMQKVDYLQDINSDSTILRITGESVCVDNFTIAPQPCPLTTSTVNNNFSSSSTFWLTQPFSLLVAIITLVILFILIGLISSVMFARKSQRELLRSKQLSRKLKLPRHERYSFQNSIDNGTTINSCCEIDTMESNRFFTHNNRFLPTVVHVRSNPQLVRYSRQSFAASSSVETSESTPHYRFSLALTEDAQVQLLTNGNNNINNVSPPFARNTTLIRQHSLITTFSHETSPSPNETNGNCQRPSSIIVTPSFCAPIIDQSESDLSMESIHLSAPSIIQNPGHCDRRRPIRESMNIGYVSDISLCDLPQYDTAVQLLAEHKIKLAQEPELIDDIGNNNS